MFDSVYLLGGTNNKCELKESRSRNNLDEK